VGQDDTIWVEIKGVEAGTPVLSSQVGAMREGLNLRMTAGNASPVTKP
jgi:hypothetical protein